MQKAKKQPRTAVAVGATVVSSMEINMDKTTEQTPMTQDKRRSCIPGTLPKLVMSTRGAFLVYGGFRLWERYEQRKQALQQQGLSNHECEQAVRQLADELGV